MVLFINTYFVIHMIYIMYIDIVDCIIVRHNKTYTEKRIFNNKISGLVFTNTNTHIHTHIYIYVCVCVYNVYNRLSLRYILPENRKELTLFTT